MDSPHNMSVSWTEKGLKKEAKSEVNSFTRSKLREGGESMASKKRRLKDMIWKSENPTRRGAWAGAIASPVLAGVSALKAKSTPQLLAGIGASLSLPFVGALAGRGYEKLSPKHKKLKKDWMELRDEIKKKASLITKESASWFSEEKEKVKEEIKHLTKQGSRLRSMLKIVPEIGRRGREIKFSAYLGGRPIGHIGTTVPRKAGEIAQVGSTHLLPEFQGMGLGKKMYGEVMRRLPQQALTTDTREVTRHAARVWKGMGKRPGYKLSPRNPNWSMHDPYKGTELAGTYGAWKPQASMRSGPLYSASLPPKAAIPTDLGPRAFKPKPLAAIPKKASVLRGKKPDDLRSKKLKEALAAGGKLKTLEQVLKLRNFKMKVDRPVGKYKGGKSWAGMVYPINYGEIPGLINPADGDPWDIIVPGPIKPKKSIRVSSIIGYVPLTDGNHKLIGLAKAKTRVNLKQIREFVKRRRRQAIKNNDRHEVLDAVIRP